MKVKDIINLEKPSLSFEVFPPKTQDKFEVVSSATTEIAKLKPDFMSVTYGAGGGTSRYTLDIAKNIKALYGVPTIAHLTCVSSTKETVKEKIRQIKAAGIENVMALRGDLTPELMNSDRSGWDYRHAVDLIRDIKESGADFCIGKTQNAANPNGFASILTKSQHKILVSKSDSSLNVWLKENYNEGYFITGC